MATESAMAASAEKAVSLEDRVAKLEADAKQPQPKPKDNWDRLQAVSSFASGALVAIVGYFLTGSVNRVLEERKLEVSTGAAVHELVLKLENGDSNEANAAAVTLAAFGSVGVVPLVAALQGDGSNQLEAAKKGLRALALSARPQVCDALATVLGNRTGLYAWRVHRQAVVLLRDLGCRAELPAVRAYAAVVADRSGVLESYRAIVIDDGTVNPESLTTLRDELAKTTALLERPPT